ncbi:hypothetical protein Tco_0506259 [Tanacetum coccineum]
MKTKHTLIDVSKLKTIKREKVVVRVAAWMWWQQHGDVGGYGGDGDWEIGMWWLWCGDEVMTAVVLWRRRGGCGDSGDGDDGVGGRGVARL